MRLGVLAEDMTDCEALGALVGRIAAEVKVSGVGVKKAWGKGCARMRTKAAARLREMARDGCIGAVLVHDLDRNPLNGEINDQAALKADLEKIERPPGLQTLICIPVEELEAWFWSDENVVKYVGRGAGKAHPSPHLIKNPKEKLIELSVGENRKPRYTTNENPALAERLNMDVCARVCPAFAHFRSFIAAIVTGKR